jgi:damage-control phosphatase, subfamily III
MHEPKLSLEDVTTGETIVQGLEGLKAALSNDAHLEPIAPNGRAEIENYNKELRSLGQLTWLAAPWLFPECYIHRLAYTFFSESTLFWQSHDIFSIDKRDSLAVSHVATIELVKRFRTILDSLRQDDSQLADEETQKTLLDQIIQIGLWGNATNLTLLFSFSVEEWEAGKVRRLEKPQEKILWSMILRNPGCFFHLFASNPHLQAG